MQLFYGLLEIPDFRISKAHPHHRAQRKAIEKEHPHFDHKELGLKAGVLAILAAVACYPRAKAEHDMRNHPERFGGKGEDDRRGLEGRIERRERLGHGS